MRFLMRVRSAVRFARSVERRPTLRPQHNHARYDRNSILMVRATGLGVSLGTLEYLQSLGLSGWVWKGPTSAALPSGLALRPDPQEAGPLFSLPRF